MPRRRGLTWTELLVLLVVLAIVTAVLIPVITGVRGRDQRVRCAANLRQIGQAILLYSNDNRGAYPRTRSSAGPVRVPTWGSGAAATQPFTDDANAPADNDVTAALFLLLRTQETTANTFVCPASPATADTFAGLTPQQRSNFTDIKKNLSYSYYNPYASDSMIKNSAWFLKHMGTSELAIAADINPGAVGINSANHDGRGQNALYADGHVAWAKDRLAETNRDDIYTTKDGKISASPYELQDSILLPTVDSPPMTND